MQITGIIDQNGYLPIHKAVENAVELGALPSSAIWALVCMALVVYIWKSSNYKRIADAKLLEMRIKDAESDSAMAASVLKLADEITKMRVIIDERVPRGRDNDRVV